MNNGHDSEHGRQLAPADAKRFILAGNATVTFENPSTGGRFTYRVRLGKPGRDDLRGIWFVSVLAGPDNERDYRYLGCIWPSSLRFGATAATGDLADAPSFRAFAWVWSRLARDEQPGPVVVWHEGRCGRCNRALTVPGSIASGLGPECASVRGI